MSRHEGLTGQESSRRYRMFAAFILAVELIAGICLVCWYLSEEREDGGRFYRVEAERVAERLRENAGEIDLSGYRTIVSVSPFQTGAGQGAQSGPGYGAAEHDYVVADINGTLYRIEYVRRQENRALFMIVAVMAFFILFTVSVLLYVWKKILKPFCDICELPVGLAKGNLAIPVRAEKSRYFGRFLWGMDMLRETLEESRRKELELQKEKRTLLLSLSHDIRTPLSAVELYTKALSEHLYDTEEKKAEALSGIARNAGDIHRYLDEMVKTMKEEFLNLEVDAGEFYFSGVMREIAAYYRDKLSVLHTELVVDEMPDCLLRGDAERVAEILQNLVENAIKYGDGKYIRLFCEEEEDCRLVTVENAGCTLREEELPDLFDPFYRGSNSRGAGGSGLGLYICQQLIRKMDGDIFVRTCGDVFRITVVIRKI